MRIPERDLAFATQGLKPMRKALRHACHFYRANTYFRNLQTFALGLAMLAAG